MNLNIFIFSGDSGFEWTHINIIQDSYSSPLATHQAKLLKDNIEIQKVFENFILIFGFFLAVYIVYMKCGKNRNIVQITCLFIAYFLLLIQICFSSIGAP